MATMEGVQVLSLSLGYVVGQALAAAAELGIADVLAKGPRTLEELARATESDPTALRRLLRTLESAGVFAEREGKYTQTALSEPLRRDVPDSVRAAVLWVAAPMHYATVADLAESVRSGQPAFERLFGKTYFEHIASAPREGRVWDEGMACFSSLEDGAIAQAYHFERGATVVDVAGGQGGFLAEVLRADPSLQGVLFDRPSVLERPTKLDEAGVLPRCRCVAGDFFQALPPGGDAYVLKRILHDWDDGACAQILRRCREVIPAHGRLLVIDAVIPQGAEPHPAKIVDLVMMSVLRGGERTEEELARLLQAAGFRLKRVIPTHSMLAITEALPA